MKRILKYVTKYKLFIIIASIAMIISIILDMFNPYLVKIMIDKVLRNSEYNLLTFALMSLAGITLTRSILGYIREYSLDYLSSRVSIDLKTDLFDHIQSLPFKYFDSMNTGELMSRMGSDVDNVWRSISFGIGLAIEQLIYFLVASVLIFRMNGQLALVTLITMPLIGYIAMKLEKEVGEAFGAISDHNAVLNTTAQENIAGVRLVKAFAREKHETLKFLNHNRTNYDLNMKQTKIWSKHFPMIEFLCNMSVLAVVCVGGMLVIGKSLSIGELVAFSQYVWMLIWPMRMIGWLTNIITQANTSAKKIFDIMDVEPEIKDKDDAIAMPVIKGSIKFENVSFKYNENYILENINLDIPAGSTVAIMGTTGSGKSSLVNLIGRYYEISKGCITVDGNDVRDICIHDLRSKMAVVSQDTFLFSESIFENIRFGNLDASFEQIKKACTDACVDEFLDSLTEGYETIIGERGLGLSGGQKQRLSIARALVKDSSILILDDATSALDMDTEYNLLKNLHHRNNKQTTFIIAHRISAVKNADMILFLENGHVVEMGNLKTLLEKRGQYYDVYNQQFTDFMDLEGVVV
ncbi:ABC transporter ATP-binding protein/permease [Clostridium tagluense]|uniref:ABC transporter ATP-binding protein n=1 Tax=Clostridium tagluense TaxID=360422 RepID=UPI001CF235DE|nr:ABC transporter ATP-binding protein [Clostridium tagluense]MCB2311383.1 ABC transporter ATP-binding protein/permease [Clostridium tagluense]MCB2315975.1 ABC transporter ATP-binding protein/permease [Clostridium tagluense]MCB2320959.1 ABC transporter ATP-binding protein/permease [Clostridium tagluense]MCB2325844.1 ABC transporter ATP-binding protein/permease [Clostridium tagluense]MCB2330699.1 ABC transporter ATP-binding protein/permease [Clostridium tagluense]